MEASPAIPPAQRLPSGRHRLTREAVVASQRGRLIEAMAHAVAEKGYMKTTVADVVDRAGVSRTTFYQQFADLEECFLAAYDTGTEIVLGRIRDRVAELPRSAGWRERARTSFAAFAEVLAEEPDFGWAQLVEVFGAGPAALKRRAEIIGVFSDLNRVQHERARHEEPGLPKLPDEVFLTLTGGLEELVRERMRTHGAAALPELVDPAMAVVVSVFGGGSRA